MQPLLEKILINNEEKQTTSSMMNGFYSSPNTELEFKFGHYVGDKFNSNVPSNVYDFILKKLLKTKSHVFTSTKTFSSSNYRKTLNMQTNQVTYMKKEPIQSIVFSKFPVKLSLSREQELKEFDIPVNVLSSLNSSSSVIRQRNRYSFSFDYYTIDLSTVSQLINNKVTIQYEIEVEFKREVKKSLGDLFEPLKWLLYYYKSVRVIDLGFLIYSYNSILVPNQQNTTTLIYENKPVNISIQVIPYMKKYAVTNKLNGVRYFLIVLKEGIFLFNRKGFITLKEEVSNSNLLGTICDGELFQGKYWIFDIMSFKDQNVTSLSLNDRLSPRNKALLLNELANKIVFKQYFSNELLIHGLRDCFFYMKQFAPMDNDGVIFQPIHEPYKNSKTYKYKPPSKLTIDFQVAPENPSKLSNIFVLLVADKGNQVTVFTGTQEHSFSGKVFISTQDIERFKLHERNNRPIIEFGYDYSKKVFYPILQRTDKVVPNYVLVARNVWEDIMNPISQEELLSLVASNKVTGEFTPGYKYKNMRATTLLDLISKYAGKNILDVSTFHMPYSAVRNNYVFNIFYKKIAPKVVNTKNVSILSSMEQVQRRKYNSIYMLNTLSFYSLESSLSFLNNIVDQLDYNGYLTISGVTNEYMNQNNNLFCFFKVNDSEYELQLYDTTNEFTSNKYFFIHEKKLIEFMKTKNCELKETNTLLKQTKYNDILSVDEQNYLSLFKFWVFAKRQFSPLNILRAGVTERVSFPFTKLALVRTGTIADGSCFIHSILSSLLSYYDEQSTEDKKNLARKFRNGLANSLEFQEWIQIGSGQVAKNLFNIIVADALEIFFKKNEKVNVLFSELQSDSNYSNANALQASLIIIEKFSAFTPEKELFKIAIEYTLSACYEYYRKQLADCSTWISQEHVEYISEKIQTNIFFINGVTRKPYLSVINPLFSKAIVILWVSEAHYESIGKFVRESDQLFIQRVFDMSDSLIHDIQNYEK